MGGPSRSPRAASAALSARALLVLQAALFAAGGVVRYEHTFVKDHRPSNTACSAWTKFVSHSIKSTQR